MSNLANDLVKTITLLFGLSKIDKYDLLDMLLKRYQDITFVRNMPISSGFKLILKAYRKINEEMLFEMWNIDRMGMEDDTFISLSDYINKAIGAENQNSNHVKKTKTKEELIEKAERIKKKFEAREV